METKTKQNPVNRNITELQMRWAREFLKCGKPGQAAIVAGYSKNRAENAGYKNSNNPKVKEYYNEIAEEYQNQLVADTKEILQYLTRVLRGEEKEEVIITDSIAPGVTKSRIGKKNLWQKDRIKAAELLAKRYGLLTDNIAIGEAPKVVDDI